MKSVDYTNIPQTNKSQNNNILNYPITKKKFTHFNVIPKIWQEGLKTTDGKVLKDAEIGVLWTIYRLAMHQGTMELHTTYKDLQKAANKSDISEDQFKRYLSKILKTNVIQLEVKRISGSYQRELIITLDLQHLENNLPRKYAPQIYPADLPRKYAPQNTSETAAVLPLQDPLIRYNNKINNINTDMIDNTKNKIDNDIDPERSEINLINVKPQADYDAGFSTPRELIERSYRNKEAAYVPRIPPSQSSSNNPLTFGESVTTPFLRDYKLTPGLLEELKVRSGTDFTHDRIIAVIRNICAKNPDTKIFGGRNAFINYMIKALKNETEYKPIARDEGQSIADRQRLEYEKLKYMVKHKMTESEVDRLNIF